MKRYFLFYAAGAVLAQTLALGAELRNAGILGNSGEQGATIVRFGDKPAMGLGVVYDSKGALWDRGGDGVLNRYAPDGRLLGTWKIPSSRISHLHDGSVILGGTLLFKQDRKLYTLPLDAAPDAKPTLLPVEVTHLSTQAHRGWVVAANEAGRESDVFLVNLAGERKPVSRVKSRLMAVEMGPDGGVYIQVVLEGKGGSVVQRLDAPTPEREWVSFDSPGSRLQWLDGHWFGNAYHGTIRRFSTEFKPDPGVVLGGQSGSFIGYVPGNFELGLGNGLAHLGENLYAVSGQLGILHLLEWRPLDRRFEIIRRIGAVQECPSLGIDSAGRVWFQGGVWQWNDGPEAPLSHGVPPPFAPGAFMAVVGEDDRLVAAGFSHGGGALFAGKLDAPTRRSDLGNGVPKDSVTGALVFRENKPAVLAVNANGKGTAVLVEAGNKAGRAPGEPVELVAKEPLKALTTLASIDKEKLVAGADGYILEFGSGAGKSWTERHRWNVWGTGGDSFGGNVYVAYSQGRLWVSDSDKHRVLCFEFKDGKPVLLAGFGVSGQPGDDLAQLRYPKAIAANGRRAVLFDSGNQRLVRLELDSNVPGR